MKIILNFFLIILVLLSFPGCLSAQTGTVLKSALYWRTLFDSSYGPDHNLINGKKYVDYRPKSTGHPFFGENITYQGTVVINQLTYEYLDLKYDICNQELIISYTDFSGAENFIMLNKEFISEFIINNHYFKRYNHSDGRFRFYEVIASGDISCLWYWKKDITHSVTSVEDFYNYMPERRETFLLIGDRFFKYKGNRSFLRQIPEPIKEEVAKYIRNNRLRVRSASESKIIQLIDHCNSLLKNSNI